MCCNRKQSWRAVLVSPKPRMNLEWFPSGKLARSFHFWPAAIPCQLTIKDHVNSALLIDSNGFVQQRYAKMKLVLFGEYVPLGEVFPWIYQFFPMGAGLKAGENPVSMEIEGVRFSPNICFESTYPHLIRQHQTELRARGREPDVIVNLSNDGWFWGSNALDMHFANNVFRAVENRKPILVAANTGFSGQIDNAGRVRQRGPRRKRMVLFCELITSQQRTVYQYVGDWPLFLCFSLISIVILQWILDFFRSSKVQLKHSEMDA